jgi:uncharacterized Fe-S cluster protein YjdI
LNNDNVKTTSRAELQSRIEKSAKTVRGRDIDWYTSEDRVLKADELVEGGRECFHGDRQ